MRVRAVFGLLVAVFFWSAAPDINSQNSTELVDGVQVVKNEILIRFNYAARLSGLALTNAEQASIAQITSAQNIDEASPVGGAHTYRLHSRSLDTNTLLKHISARKDVEYVEPNFVYHEAKVPNDPDFGSLYGMQKISAPSAWDISTGSTISAVGIIDSGVDYTHPDLGSNVWSAPSAYSVTIEGTVINCAAGTHGINVITKTCDPLDDQIHGTEVSGVLGALGNNGVGVTGVNWTAQIVAAKAVDFAGQITTADAIDAIDFMVQLNSRFPSLDLRVLSNSWGGPEFSQSLFDEIGVANNSNMLFVAAAGNNGTNNDTAPIYPASYGATNVIAVAATDSNDQLASLSNFGASSVHLGAPGVDILTTSPGGSYTSESGTSFSTPYVSGAASLILSACSLDTAALKSIILNNVDPLPSLSGKTITGGRLNVSRAIHACALPAPNAGPGSPLAAHVDGVANTDEAFYLGSDQHIHELWWSGGIWHHTDVTAAGNAPLAVSGTHLAVDTNTAAGSDDVFYPTSDGHIHELFWSGGVWKTLDVTSAAAAPAAVSGSPLTAQIDSVANNIEEVFYLGSDQHVHQLWFGSGIWHTTDVTAAAVAPTAISGSPVVAHADTLANTDEVFYIGGNQHILELWWSGGVWNVSDVTTAAAAPVAASGSSLSSHVDTIANADEVFYLGADSISGSPHVHQLWWSAGVWHTTDVTAASGAPLAVSGSPLASHDDTLAGTDEVFYLGSNQHVYELSWSNGVWHFTDTNAASGGLSTEVASPVSAYLDTIANADEVMYLGTDQHVHELYWQSGIWHAVDVTASVPQ